MNDIIRFDEIDEQGPQVFSGTYEIPAAELDRTEVSNIGPAQIEARAEKGLLPGEYLVDGKATFTIDFNCSRCLEPYPFANASSYHIRFRSRPEVSEENEEIEIEEGGLDVEFYSEREIPLRNLAIEQIQLSIPMKPLCDESCLGLCPHCGANRNREACDCESTIVDERWGTLQNIRDQLAKKKEI